MLLEAPMATNWFKDLRTVHRVPFPNSYIVFDVETTGVDTETDLILQFGHLTVVDGVPCAPSAIVLDWTRCPDVDQHWLYNRIEKTTRDIAMKGGKYKFTYKRMKEEGVDPQQVLTTYFDFFKPHLDNQGYFLTHNGFAYDRKIVASHFTRFLGQNFYVPGSQIMDTGLFEKASQLEMVPRAAEGLDSFYRRIVGRYGKGVPWSLAQHCIPKYGLRDKYSLDVSNAHDAAFDCLATHCLFSEFRLLANREDA